MLFNVEKCKVIKICVIKIINVGYDLDGFELISVNEEKVLGVIVSNDLKWRNIVRSRNIRCSVMYHIVSHY